MTATWMRMASDREPYARVFRRSRRGEEGFKPKSRNSDIRAKGKKRARTDVWIARVCLSVCAYIVRVLMLRVSRFVCVWRYVAIRVSVYCEGVAWRGQTWQRRRKRRRKEKKEGKSVCECVCVCVCS